MENEIIDVLARSVPLTLLDGCIFRGAILFALDDILYGHEVIVRKYTRTTATGTAIEVLHPADGDGFISVIGRSSAGEPVLHTTIWKKDWHKLVLVIDDAMGMCHVARRLAMHFGMDPGDTAPHWYFNPRARTWYLGDVHGIQHMFIQNSSTWRIDRQGKARALAYYYCHSAGQWVKERYVLIAELMLRKANVTFQEGPETLQDAINEVHRLRDEKPRDGSVPAHVWQDDVRTAFFRDHVRGLL